MNVVLIANERDVRERVRSGLGSDIELSAFATVADAETALFGTTFDLVVIDTEVYPGFGSRDADIQRLADVLPRVRYAASLAYWEVGLRLLEMLRSEESKNRLSPILVRFPDMPDSVDGVQDVLTTESVREDFKGKEPVAAVYGGTPEDLAGRINAAARLI